MPDAVTLLQNDHRKVEGLFERFESGDRRVLEQICEELTVHTAIEETILYPALADVPEGDTMRHEAQVEHDEVKEAIDRLRTIGSAAEEVDHLVETIVRGVTHHVEEEEQRVLPAMRDALGEERMARLGDKLLVAKREHLSSLGSLGTLTKDELYKMAQVAELPGRSDMTKDQLVDALRS